MSTKIYGASDDLVEFDGDVAGEVGCYGTDDREQGVLVVCSDGTLLEVKYGKGDAGIWGIDIIHVGVLFDRKEDCPIENENAKLASDVVHFKDGLSWAYAATGSWEKVQ